jgi:hypothetical protein
MCWISSASLCYSIRPLQALIGLLMVSWFVHLVLQEVSSKVLDAGLSEISFVERDEGSAEEGEMTGLVSISADNDAKVRNIPDPLLKEANTDRH